jgi:spoIIIJ-associated protein
MSDQQAGGGAPITPDENERAEMREEARAVLLELLEHMGIEGDVDTREEPEQLVLDVTGPETGLVIGKKGATLDAIQYFMNKVFESDEEDPTGWRRIVVDAAGYRARRQEALIELANRLADRAKKTGQIIAMEPMSPHDRRIIHVTLAGMAGIQTRSEGEGALRHLLIVPEGASGRPTTVDEH